MDANTHAHTNTHTHTHTNSCANMNRSVCPLVRPPSQFRQIAGSPPPPLSQCITLSREPWDTAREHTGLHRDTQALTHTHTHAHTHTLARTHTHTHKHTHAHTNIHAFTHTHTRPLTPSSPGGSDAECGGGPGGRQLLRMINMTRPLGATLLPTAPLHDDGATLHQVVPASHGPHAPAGGGG